METYGELAAKLIQALRERDEWLGAANAARAQLFIVAHERDEWYERAKQAEEALTAVPVDAIREVYWLTADRGQYERVAMWLVTMSEVHP